MLKFFALNSIRSRMVSGFLFLTLLIVILSIVSIVIFDNITRIARTHSNISQLEIYTLSLMKSDNDFFDLEPINESYFRTHQSVYLRTRDSLNHLISQEIQILVTDKRLEKSDISPSLIIIDSTLTTYNTKFQELEKLVFKKGFKDYGVEGAMRLEAHALEQIIQGDQLVDLLLLRRHEKDFLLRSDSSYSTAFENRTVILMNKLSVNPKRNEEAIQHLRAYEQYFSELSTIQTELGLSSSHGLRNELNKLTYDLSKQYYALSEYSYTFSENVYHGARIFYVALVTGAILFSLLSGYWISRRLSGPIANLSRAVQSAVYNKEELHTDLSLKKAAVEVTALATAYSLLIDQLKQQMAEVNKHSSVILEKNSELEKINRELDNFLYSTAHDLRSPLSSLLGLLNIIRHENKQEELEEYYILMEKSVQRSEHFISQIVSFSKNKRLTITPEKLNLHQIIADILESHQFIDGAVKIKKTVFIDGVVPFYSDRNRIIMIFTNLISNAIKYADLDKPSPTISMTIDITSEKASIKFEDNGIGIEKEHIANIFDMFFRANARSEGAGLGLFIFKETLTRLNGEITVNSEPGIGTVFYITIPNLISTPVNEPVADHVS